jgi:hypothetical protein
LPFDLDDVWDVLADTFVYLSDVYQYLASFFLDLIQYCYSYRVRSTRVHLLYVNGLRVTRRARVPMAIVEMLVNDQYYNTHRPIHLDETFNVTTAQMIRKTLLGPNYSHHLTRFGINTNEMNDLVTFLQNQMLLTHLKERCNIPTLVRALPNFQSSPTSLTGLRMLGRVDQSL